MTPMTARELFERPLAAVAAAHPCARTFFDELNLTPPDESQSARAYFRSLDEFALADCGMDAEQLEEALYAYVGRMEALAHRAPVLESLTICGGTNKHGKPEPCTLTVHPGEVTCIVGPTGSGKSRLL